MTTIAIDNVSSAKKGSLPEENISSKIMKMEDDECGRMYSHTEFKEKLLDSVNRRLGTKLNL